MDDINKVSDRIQENAAKAVEILEKLKKCDWQTRDRVRGMLPGLKLIRDRKLVSDPDYNFLHFYNGFIDNICRQISNDFIVLLNYYTVYDPIIEKLHYSIDEIEKKINEIKKEIDWVNKRKEDVKRNVFSNKDISTLDVEYNDCCLRYCFKFHLHVDNMVVKDILLMPIIVIAAESGLLNSHSNGRTQGLNLKEEIDIYFRDAILEFTDIEDIKRRIIESTRENSLKGINLQTSCLEEMLKNDSLLEMFLPYCYSTWEPGEKEEKDLDEYECYRSAYKYISNEIGSLYSKLEGMAKSNNIKLNKNGRSFVVSIFKHILELSYENEKNLSFEELFKYSLIEVIEQSYPWEALVENEIRECDKELNKLKNKKDKIELKLRILEAREDSKRKKDDIYKKLQGLKIDR